jgi:hypothetical protein
MNVELPDSTIEFAKVLAGALGQCPSDTRSLFELLHELGVIDLAGEDSADPENAHLDVAVALEEIARAGRRAPVAESICSRARGLDVTAGFVALPAGPGLDGERLVPYGSSATSILGGRAETLVVTPMPRSTRPARIEIDDGHLWLPADRDVPTLLELDRGFAWRAAAASTVGAMAKATDMAVAHARDRVQFGRPLASFQALQFRLAECHWRVLGLRLLVREAAWRADRTDPRADVVSALAWLYARDVGRIVTKHAHQVHGAIGFTRELGLTAVTGSAAMLRALYAASDAARLVRESRGWKGSVPPSTVLAGFRS